MSRPSLDSSASAAAFPLGGIGTGNVSIGARGEFRDWELGYQPAKGKRNPFTFSAIHTAPVDDPSASVTRVLEAPFHPPHDGDQGYYAGDVAGLPRVQETRMRGTYPLLALDFVDDALPVSVSLTAFTPFVPLDADDSGIPCAVLRYEVRNDSATPMRAAIAMSMSNPIGAELASNVFHYPQISGTPQIDWRDDGNVRGLWMTSDLPSDHLGAGTVALTTPDSSVTAKPRWLRGMWNDGAQVFWNEFRATGTLRPEERETLDPEPLPDWLPRLRVGSFAIEHEILPGTSVTYEFHLSWSFPNRPRGWGGNIIHDDPHIDQVVKNHYAIRYPDAWSVATDLEQRLPQLELVTRNFVRAFYSSSLPDGVVDRVGANLAAIRSSTCFRLEDGQFAAWEGSFDHVGSCEGTCTHVWNYAQSLAWLFPELESSARTVEFAVETRDDGRMNFRTNQIFGSPAWDFHPAVDGQMGAIIRVLREWKLSGDIQFLHTVWPHLRRAMDYALTAWDSNGDCVLDSKQHNTYDIEFYGENSLSNSMFFAALRSSAQIARVLGEEADARRWSTAADNGAALMDSMLFNGEYYQQNLEDIDAERYQYGTGVLSDQLLGQLLAHVVGLGHVLPEEHVQSAIAAVFRHNFRSDLSHHESVQRTYALGDEAGLLLCSWPRGGRPRIPFVYCDEVWTGIEYQVAAHLIYEGLVDEGLTVVEAVRQRHSGRNRNPWNEVECGNHYARSLASWAVLLACTGQQSDVATGSLSFAPAIGGPQRVFFSTGMAWGSAEISDTAVTLTVEGGVLSLTTVKLHGRILTGPSGPPTDLNAGSTRIYHM